MADLYNNVAIHASKLHEAKQASSGSENRLIPGNCTLLSQEFKEKSVPF